VVGLEAGQQCGLTRKRESAGRTGRTGRPEDEQRLAFLFRTAGSFSVTVQSTGRMSSPGKVKWNQYNKPNMRVKKNMNL
jgi:hypothetical protein